IDAVRLLELTQGVVVEERHRRVPTSGRQCVQMLLDDVGVQELVLDGGDRRGRSRRGPGAFGHRVAAENWVRGRALPARRHDYVERLRGRARLAELDAVLVEV